MSLLTLGVETCGLAGAIALRRSGETVDAVSIEQVGRRHAQTLISEVDGLLRRHGLTARQLEVIAVSIGPGSFTGLRVGVVFAKTLAYVIGCRLVAVDTFRAIAASSPNDVSEVFIVSDAQRGDLLVGRYVRDRAGSRDASADWTRRGDISIEPADAWCRQRNEGVVVSGPAVEALRLSLPPSARVLDPEFRLPRADLIATLGEYQAASDDLADLWTLEPFYLRRSAAEEKAV